MKRGGKNLKKINYHKLNKVFADFLKDVEDSEDMTNNQRIKCYEGAVETLDKSLRKELSKYAFRRDETE